MRLRAADGCFVLTNHPFLSGRPSRGPCAGRALIEYCVLPTTDVWVTSIGENRGTRPQSRPDPPASVERPDPRDF